MSTPVRFPGSQGELAGAIDRPVGEPRAWALFAHCFTCGKDLPAARNIALALAARGFAVLRFDFAGLGESEGEFAATTFTSNVEDLLAAADYLRAHEQAPTLLVGHSLGGAALLAAAGHIPEARAVATLAAPAEPTHLKKLLDELAPDLEREGEARLRLGPRELVVRRALLDDLTQHDQRQRVARLDRALLVLHAPFDETVGIDEARKLFEAAKHPKSFVSLDDADHLLSRPADARYAGEVIAAWGERYLPPLPEAPESAGVLVRSTGQGYAQDLAVGRHRLRADEPVALGGADTGPAPYGFLAAGLGACTSMTIQMYAQRKQLPLEGVEVRVRHEKLPPPEPNVRADRFVREITLTGPLDAEQRARLLEIADRCPVHRTLEGRVEIQTRLTGSSQDV